MTAVEVAVTFAIVGSMLAVAVPAFFRELRASKFVEPASGVREIAEKATAYAGERPVARAYPDDAPLTPAAVPRGARVVDPDGTWDHPTWKALGFRASAEGAPHAYSFAFESENGAARSSFTAVAHGDLDGDGALSTFQVSGHDTTPEGDAGGGAGPVVDPGMVVDAELE
jgi:type II secretory pathway pseudopilin PulG